MSPTRTATVIGVDPGPVPGIVRLDRRGGLSVVQCTADVAFTLIDALIEDTEGTIVLAVEAFVVGTRAARSSTPKAGTATRELIGVLTQAGDWHGVQVVQRRAADVKPWATDRRLDAAGLLDATKGMRHARDAARHALYAAVRDAGFPDPLSRSAGSRTPPAPRPEGHRT